MDSWARVNIAVAIRESVRSFYVYMPSKVDRTERKLHQGFFSGIFFSKKMVASEESQITDSPRTKFNWAIGFAALLFLTLFIVFAVLYSSERNRIKPRLPSAPPLDSPETLAAAPLPVTAIDGGPVVPALPFPRIVHMLQIPWTGDDQHLKTDRHDFDHSWYQRARDSVPADWTVRLWTYEDLKTLVAERYSEKLWEYIWRRCARPVQAVDFLRLLVAYEYGGVSLQYKSDLKQPDKMTQFFTPSPGKTAKVFYEYPMSEEHCRNTAVQHPIRNGKPEYPDRIMFQVFAGCKHAGFLGYAIHRTLYNLALNDAVSNYDVLFIGGNDMITEAYHDYLLGGRNDLQLVLRPEFNQHVKVHGTNSWFLKTD
jgi:hypothetical protein